MLKAALKLHETRKEGILTRVYATHMRPVIYTNKYKFRNWQFSLQHKNWQVNSLSANVFAK